ncbi:MAG TPA: tRNA (adenosine(37)-N6)-threonylcarbamoyltransferase complex dimerization subunit type 1 TsaB [Polyangiaceae bacterium]
MLGIETSTRRGSVALWEDGRVIGAREHAVPNAHAEQLLPLLESVLAEAGWSRSSLDRLAVGIGPGSFTGLRVGIALVQGIALGLDRPLVGCGSLATMARGVPAEDARLRVPVLDARRGELFAAVYGPAGAVRALPFAVPRSEAGAALDALLAGQSYVLVGEGAAELSPDRPRLTRPDLDLPHASWVAALGAELDPASAPAEPEYVRGPGATLPNLPPSPLDQPGTA